MRAATLVLPGEDTAAFEARLAGWTANLEPRDEVEEFLVRRAAQMSWQLDRVERALAARAAMAGMEAEDRRAEQAEDVVVVGRRLLWDHRGPLALYPSIPDLGQRKELSWSGRADEPDDPARLVILLESTAMGCAWMLDRWAELRDLLEEGLEWLPPDRLKGIRLLGRQPVDAIEDERVRTIYLASAAMGPPGEDPFADIASEFYPLKWEKYSARLEKRLAASGRPADPASGRAALLAIVSEEEERLQRLLEAHLENELPAGEGLAFDDSPEGERLRRYQATCDRTLLRVLDTLRKYRREAGGQASAARKKSEPNDSASRLLDLLGSLAPPEPCAATNEANAPGSAASEPVIPTNEANAPPATAGEPRIATNEPNRPGRAPQSPPAVLLALLALVLAMGLAFGLASRTEVAVLQETSDQSPARAPVATVGQVMTGPDHRAALSRPTARPPAGIVA